MKKKTVVVFSAMCLACSLSFAGNDYYIQKGAFSKIVSIRNSVTRHSDNILNINAFSEIGEKVDWTKATAHITYIYNGVDNNHNLHITKESYKNILEDQKTTTKLIFQLDSKDSAEITLIGQNSLKEPLLVKLKVHATNHGLQVKYLGKLPKYEMK